MTQRRQNIISAIVVANLVWIGTLVTMYEVIVANRPLPMSAGLDVGATPVNPREARLRGIADNGLGQIVLPPATVFRTGIEIPILAGPDESRLAATRVTIHAVQIPIDEAMKAIAAQSHVSIDVSPKNLLTRANAPQYRVTLDGDSMPLEEVLLRLCAQTNLMLLPEEPSGGQRNVVPIDGSPRVLLNMGNGDRRAGIWSVSGAFAFDLARIDQTGTLRPDGLADDGITLSIRLHVEPKVWVLAPATATTVTEMVDENGKSLLAGPASAGQAGLWARNLNVNLPPGHGKWIKHLAADTLWTIGTTTGEMSIANVVKAAGSKLSAGAIDATVQNVTQPADASQVNTQLTVAVAYSAPDAKAVDWPTIGPLLRRGHVWIAGWGAPTSIQAQPDNKAKPPTMRITYQWNNMTGGPPGAMQIELPLAVEKVHVPMEFDDVPLP